MRVLMVVALLALVAAVYGDLVCGTDYCKKNPCQTQVASSSCKTPSVYREKHAGKCACCPACVTLLKEGETCKKYSQELGETPGAVCREPLVCIAGKCQTVKRS